MSVVGGALNPHFEYLKFCLRYGCSAEEGEETYLHRFRIFSENIESIHRHNLQGHNFTLRVNQFANLTKEEIQDRYKIAASSYKCDAEFSTEDSSATSLDWRAEGAVTPIKNQGSCGSCWAFSTVGALEGWNKIQNGELVSLSEQELVDCDTNDYGCLGGLLDVPYDYITSKGGLCSEEEYSYKGSGSTCESGNCGARYAQVEGCWNIVANNEKALKSAVDRNPVTVAIEADQFVFQFYGGGIFDASTCGKNLDHGVLIVGYGEQDGVEYWIVKNSWGESWGEDGYIRMKRNVNICGISLNAVVPH